MEGEASEGTSLAIPHARRRNPRMNLQFLGIDEPTDVLAFPDEADDFIKACPMRSLGDIAIALPTAERGKGDRPSLDAELTC
jgi:ssRNA-specific RNase YbeY (16S rRNA maturation enzyme)